MAKSILIPLPKKRITLGKRLRRFPAHACLFHQTLSSLYKQRLKRLSRNAVLPVGGLIKSGNRSGISFIPKKYRNYAKKKVPEMWEPPF